MNMEFSVIMCSANSAVRCSAVSFGTVKYLTLCVFVFVMSREIFCDNVEDIRMSPGPLWGNHLTLIAAANCYQRPIRTRYVYISISISICIYVCIYVCIHV